MTVAGRSVSLLFQVFPGGEQGLELAYPTVASCAVPLDTDCTYYSACLERAIPCGAEGYALGFGEKFCTAFRGAELSPAGTKWMKTVMGCLQRVLAPEVVAKGKFTTEAAPRAVCQDLFDRAFASHPGCYTSEESSICFLPPGDLATVLQTIGAQEILKPRTGVQVVSTVGICVKQLTGRLFGFGSKKSGSGSAFTDDHASRASFGEDLSREELGGRARRGLRLELGASVLAIGGAAAPRCFGRALAAINLLGDRTT